MIIKKTISHIKWFLATIPVGLFALITSPIVYPLAYLWNKYIGKYNPFWFWLDDEIFDSNSNADWLIACNGNVNDFKYLYEWHAFRNTCWNLKNLIKPETARGNCLYNREVIIQVKQDNLYRAGRKVNIYGTCIEMAGFKWIDKWGNEGWQVFSGEKVSYKFSTIGVCSLWYEANGKLYYRYSKAKEYSLFGKRIYYTFKMGVSEKRFLLILKINVK